LQPNHLYCLSSLSALELTVERVHGALCLELGVHGCISTLRERELIAKRSHATTLLSTVGAAAVRAATHGVSTAHRATAATHRATATATGLTGHYARELGKCLIQRGYLRLHTRSCIQQVVITGGDGGHATALGKDIAIVGIGRAAATMLLLSARVASATYTTAVALLVMLSHSI
jgi:hypothetical protein